ncbi:MAG: selenocysteine-specific translation elongation factor [Acidimicrobiia bacterium]
MPVVGTAGHVDHGKSTLVQALSGRDPDRWQEEKERGLTIDLGFAWSEIGGTEVSFVDVPGHERYSKNMLAGIEAIDVALLVVAADEGWMPQSEEHLAVLDLLEVDRAVVALTKVDRVDDELADLAELEVSEHLEGTTLQGAEVVRVAAVGGRGLDDLRAALNRALGGLPEPDLGRPRLWVDRSFSAVGAGTVVTGTLLGGSLGVDMKLGIFPGGRQVRIRGIESHERSHDHIGPGRRTALNLVGVDTGEVSRGAMLGRVGDWRETTRFAAGLRTARYVTELPSRGAYHLHVGSGAWPVRLRQLEEGVALVDLSAPLPLAVGDRFIIRDTGRRLVVGGGRVLDPAPPRPRRLRPALRDLRAVVNGSPDERATALLSARGRDRLVDLAQDSGGGTPLSAVVAGPWALTASEATDLGRRLALQVATFHRDNPLRPGLPTAEAASRLGVDQAILEVLVDRHPDLTIDASHVREFSFTGVRSDEQDRVWQQARSRLRDAGVTAVPRLDELELGQELAHALIREGELIKVSDEFVYLPEQVEQLVEIVRSMDSPFTVPEFKDRSGLSRKYAVPFLEWADRTGITVRQGDARRVR